MVGGANCVTSCALTSDPNGVTSLRQGERAERLRLSLAPPTGAMKFFKRRQQMQATLETPNSSTVELEMPEKEMHHLSREVSTLRDNLSRARAQFATLRGALSQTEKSLHEMLHQLKKNHAEELMAHSQAINSLQVELEAVRWGEREEQLRREHDATLHLAYIELAEYRASHMHDDSEYDAHVVHITVLQKVRPPLSQQPPPFLQQQCVLPKPTYFLNILDEC
ncbi:uncharacterized protein LOC142923201 [Petromyzon marinus]|uniref:uncharacterized protein LOC142923201 n=1 Tax=Petromyzon marinus TaxID=7757 RepID=UPI003F70D10D